MLSGESASFAKTTQADIINKLNSANELKLFDNIWESGKVLSAVTMIPANVSPKVIAGVGYKHRDNNIVSNMIGVQELPSPPQLKPEVKNVVLKRYRTNFNMVLSKEARDSTFVEEITRRELRNACVLSIERGLLYGTPTFKGILSEIGYTSNNWTANDAAPNGSGAWWSAQAIYVMFHKFFEAGYQKENATFFAGSKAYAQLLVYRISGAVTESLIKFDHQGQGRIFGVPIHVVQCLDSEDIIFGDFSMLFLKVIEQSSHDFIAPNNSSLRINYDAVFEAGFADKSGFFRYKVKKSNHDN